MIIIDALIGMLLTTGLTLSVLGTELFDEGNL